MHKAMKAAQHYVLKYNLCGGNLTAEKIKDILRRQGFLLFRHNKQGASPERTQKVLESLELIEYAKGKDGFTYISRTDKAVFTGNHMGEDEELYVLLHEQGHISCNHSEQHGVLAYSDVFCEQEANAFAFHVMRYAKLLHGWRMALQCAAVFGISAVMALLL